MRKQEIIVEIIILLITVCTFFLSNYISNSQFNIEDRANKISDFIAKQDDIAILEALADSGMNYEAPTVLQNAYGAYLHAQGRKFQSEEQFHFEISEVNNINDYNKLVDLRIVKSFNDTNNNDRQALLRIENLQNVLFSLSIILQIIVLISYIKTHEPA